MTLEEKFREIKDNQERLTIGRVAKVCFSGSTGRVFPNTTGKPEGSASVPIREVLKTIAVDELPEIKNQEAFKAWFEEQLKKVFKVIPCKTSKNEDLSEGARKWGYAAKILCLFLRDMIEHCRYFTPEQAEKVRQWLYCPIDKNVIDNMKECGVSLPFSKIMEVDTREKFYDEVQERLSEAADNVEVPRILFDYVWSDRP